MLPLNEPCEGESRVSRHVQQRFHDRNPIPRHVALYLFVNRKPNSRTTSKLVYLFPVRIYCLCDNLGAIQILQKQRVFFLPISQKNRTIGRAIGRHRNRTVYKLMYVKFRNKVSDQF